jgi:hypothetical protein
MPRFPSINTTIWQFADFSHHHHNMHHKSSWIECNLAPCPARISNAITLSIQPDLLVSGQQLLITVTGTLTTGTIDASSQLFVGGMDATDADLFTPVSADFCSGEARPIATGASFSSVLTFSWQALFLQRTIL